MMLFLLFVGLPIFLIFLLPKIKKSGKDNLPPGPIGLPFIGNLHQYDSLTPHLYFWELSKQYGKIFSLKLASAPMVVVSSPELGKEVLKTKDLVFCSRPSLLGQQKLSYNGHDIACAPYNDYWREMRKIGVLHLFSLKKVQLFSPIRGDEVSRMINKISQQVNTSQITNLSNLMISLTSTIICRVAFGVRFNEEAHERKRFDYLLTEAQAMMASSFVSDFFPSYLKTVIKEAFRLYPPVPLLVPRVSMDKSTLQGYEIQPGTIIHVNSWAIARDPEIWENPEEFIPERFLNNDIDFKGQDYELIPFGAGRRGCPGITLGVASTELALSNLLYAFDWELPRGMKKEDIDTNVMPGITMHKKNELFLIPKSYC
ncbi:6,7,8-trihydroxycoumarin synthase-like [Lycium barbarum]|uniref:6,7,8-trihydroxycoumarin synthase-like n=1 Tax=Lycium barbarum TaxID=112863 RepID=UPI00293F2A19|nr:6,7,8-trihydroxycoumarin synthase-like [Lycium barbarum]